MRHWDRLTSQGPLNVLLVAAAADSLPRGLGSFLDTLIQNHIYIYATCIYIYMYMCMYIHIHV